MSTVYAPRRTRARWIALIAVVVVVVAGLVAWGIYRTKSPTEHARPSHVTDNGGLLAADEGGAVPVEIYFDFSCPECKVFEAAATPMLNQLLAQKKIKLIWHPLGYLDGKSDPPGYSTRMASVMGCAADGGKLKALGEVMFVGQPPAGTPGYNDDQIIEVAGGVGLNQPSFAQCVRSMKYKDWVSATNEKAAERGVDLALAVFVAGQKVEVPTVENVTAAVAASS